MNALTILTMIDPAAAKASSFVKTSEDRLAGRQN